MSLDFSSKISIIEFLFFHLSIDDPEKTSCSALWMLSGWQIHSSMLVYGSTCSHAHHALDWLSSRCGLIAARLLSFSHMSQH